MIYPKLYKNNESLNGITGITNGHVAYSQFPVLPEIDINLGDVIKISAHRTFHAYFLCAANPSLGQSGTAEYIKNGESKVLKVYDQFGIRNGNSFTVNGTIYSPPDNFQINVENYYDGSPLPVNVDIMSNEGGLFSVSAGNDFNKLGYINVNFGSDAYTISPDYSHSRSILLNRGYLPRQSNPGWPSWTDVNAVSLGGFTSRGDADTVYDSLDEVSFSSVSVESVNGFIYCKFNGSTVFQVSANCYLQFFDENDVPVEDPGILSGSIVDLYNGEVTFTATQVGEYKLKFIDDLGNYSIQRIQIRDCSQQGTFNAYENGTYNLYIKRDTLEPECQVNLNLTVSGVSLTTSNLLFGITNLIQTTVQSGSTTYKAIRVELFNTGRNLYITTNTFSATDGNRILIGNVSSYTFIVTQIGQFLITIDDGISNVSQTIVIT